MKVRPPTSHISTLFNFPNNKKRHLISQMPLGIIVIESKSDATSDLPSEIIKCYKNSIPKLPTVRDAISFYSNDYLNKITH